MAKPNNKIPCRAPICVLKFGSSVLTKIEDYDAAAHEIYRHVRNGEKVVAVVSALAGETDALFGLADLVGVTPPADLTARLVRVGELKSSALMALALANVGIRTSVLDPHEIGLTADGDALDANLTGIDADAVAARLTTNEVLVAPGFIAEGQNGVVTLGRGGTDLTAVFFAHEIGADRVRLIKDVDGVYARDPNKYADAARFDALDYDEAVKVSAGLIQEKAILEAKAKGVVIEVASPGKCYATRVAHTPIEEGPRAKDPQLKVALLGRGAVGEGTLQHLLDRPDLFTLGPVLVRNVEAHQASAPEGIVFTNDLDTALANKPDIIVELVGGADWPADIIERGLNENAHIVTANKAALAKHYDRLVPKAYDKGLALHFSAAVGGGTPIIEALDRLAVESGVRQIEGVMNGTGNYLLARLSEGWSFDAALKKAQELGFAEADPSTDVDGHDAADKLSLIIRRAFGRDVAPNRIPKQSLADITPELAQAALARGEVLKQVGTAALNPDGSITAKVEILSLPQDHPLAAAKNEQNAFLVTERTGQVHIVFGKGAGRWPTAASVFADIMDIYRTIVRQQSGIHTEAPKRPMLSDAFHEAHEDALARPAE